MFFNRLNGKSQLKKIINRTSYHCGKKEYIGNPEITVFAMYRKVLKGSAKKLSRVS